MLDSLLPHLPLVVLANCVLFCFAVLYSLLLHLARLDSLLPHLETACSSVMLVCSAGQPAASFGFSGTGELRPILFCSAVQPATSFG